MRVCKRFEGLLFFCESKFFLFLIIFLLFSLSFCWPLLLFFKNLFFSLDVFFDFFLNILYGDEYRFCLFVCFLSQEIIELSFMGQPCCLITRPNDENASRCHCGLLRNLGVVSRNKMKASCIFGTRQSNPYPSYKQIIPFFVFVVFSLFTGVTVPSGSKCQRWDLFCPLDVNGWAAGSFVGVQGER